MKVRIKRADQHHLYVDWPLRCVYAVECVESITAPVDVQVTELEWMMQEDEPEPVGKVD
jgi:hypothetical protein